MSKGNGGAMWEVGGVFYDFTVKMDGFGRRLDCHQGPPGVKSDASTFGKSWPIGNENEIDRQKY